jgi:hypothetical protein
VSAPWVQQAERQYADTADNAEQVVEASALNTRIATVPNVVAEIRSLRGDFYLRREVADALDVSPATLRRLAIAEPTLLGPSAVLMWGRLSVPVYDPGAVSRLHTHLARYRSHCGRRRLWTDDERRARRTAHSAAGYRRRRAATLIDRGDHAAAERMLTDADCIATGLLSAQTDRKAAPRFNTDRLISTSDVRPEGD